MVDNDEICVSMILVNTINPVSLFSTPQLRRRARQGTHCWVRNGLIKWLITAPRLLLSAGSVHRNS